MLQKILFTAFVFSFQHSIAQVEKTYLIPFYENKANVLEIDVRINGYGARFIFDPGATMISFGNKLYQELIKSTHLIAGDIKYKTKTRLANGSLADAAVVKIKKITLGDFEMTDAEALVQDDDSPSLIGQSVLQKFSTVTIDNVNKRLILKQSVSTDMLRFSHLNLIPCSISIVDETDRIRKAISSDSSLVIQSITQETKVPPPPKVVDRISNKITVRYFDSADLQKANGLQQRLIKTGYTTNQVNIEDMTIYYKNPIPGYLEIWVKQL